MADAISRMTSGKKIGVFLMQHGPGAENAFGGVAQAYGESVPILVMPMGYARNIAHTDPQFNSVLNFKHVTKSTEPVTNVQTSRTSCAARSPNSNGRGRPSLIEVPTDVFGEEFEGEIDYTPVYTTRSGPDPEA